MVRKKRTLREITNIINRMRELGASIIKVDDIEVTFVPEILKGAERTPIELPDFDINKFDPPKTKTQEELDKEEEIDLFEDA